MTSLPLHALAASEAQPSPSEEVDFDVHVGDMREVLAGFEPDSFDSLVTDPPYGLSFMGKGWDKGVPDDKFWKEALRVAKPGAHLLAFGGTRTYHRLMCAIEDAGWEIRDCIMWVYGSGFPKSHNVGKAIDREAGVEREVVGPNPYNAYKGGHNHNSEKCRQAGKLSNITAPATDAARQWDGWGTALKPAWEPIIVARKPLEGTVAQNVLKHGTGAMNIDATRVGFVSEADEAESKTKNQHADFGSARVTGNVTYGDYSMVPPKNYNPPSGGRWPANLIHDGSEEVVSLFPADAARFFYCAKANKKDRDEGCGGLEAKDSTVRQVASEWKVDARHPDGGYMNTPQAKARNNHPTVKPTDLMRYCVKLVTPVGGTVLDPFMGSGSTGKAALLEGMNFVGVELDPEYAKIATARLNAAQTKRNSAC